MAGKRKQAKRPKAAKRGAPKKSKRAKKPARTVGGKHKLPTADEEESNAGLSQRKRKRGSGALLVWLQDLTGKLHRMVDGIAIILRGGYIYPLPVRDLTQILAADGRTIHLEGDDPKGLGFMWDPTAEAMNEAELDEISVSELEAHRMQLETTLQKVRMEVDAVSGLGTYDKLWARGAKRTRLPIGTGKKFRRVKRAGSEGSLHEVRRHYFNVLPAKHRTLAEIPDITPPMPKTIEKLEGDPLYCPKCGNVQPSRGELRKHDKLEHEQRRRRRPRPGSHQHDMPEGAQVFETETQFIGEMLEAGQPGTGGKQASD